MRRKHESLTARKLKAIMRGSVTCSEHAKLGEGGFFTTRIFCALIELRLTRVSFASAPCNRGWRFTNKSNTQVPHAEQRASRISSDASEVVNYKRGLHPLFRLHNYTISRIQGNTNESFNYTRVFAQQIIARVTVINRPATDHL